MTQRIGQKDFAVETLERRIALKEQHPRVAQHGGGSLDLPFLASEFSLVRRRIVLELFTGLEVISTRSYFRLLCDAVAAAEGGQGRIRDIRSAAHQFFMDPDEIAFAERQEFQDLHPILFG